MREGFSIYSGGQIAFFEPMMKDRSLELCQDLTPNTKEGNLIMYAAVWRTDGESIVQVGISPDHLMKSLEKAEINGTRCAFAAGMNGHIAKPVDVPKLLSTISEIFKQKE